MADTATSVHRSAMSQHFSHEGIFREPSSETKEVPEGREDELQDLWDQFSVATYADEKQVLLARLLHRFNEAFEREASQSGQLSSASTPSPVDESYLDADDSSEDEEEGTPGGLFHLHDFAESMHSQGMVAMLVREVDECAGSHMEDASSSQSESSQQADLEWSITVVTSLSIITRKRSSRQHFNDAGGIDALVRLLHGMKQHVRLVVDILEAVGMGDSSDLIRTTSAFISSPSVGSSLQFGASIRSSSSTSTGYVASHSERLISLMGVLACILEVLANCVAAEVRLVKSKAKRVEEDATQTMMSTENLDVLLDTLSLLQKLRELKLTPFAGPLMLLLLQLLHKSMLQNQDAAQSFESSGGLQSLLQLLVWPSDDLEQETRLDHWMEEWWIQFLSTAVIMEAIDSHKDLLKKAAELKAEKCFSLLIRWSCLPPLATFGKRFLLQPPASRTVSLQLNRAIRNRLASGQMDMRGPKQQEGSLRPAEVMGRCIAMKPLRDLRFERGQEGSILDSELFKWRPFAMLVCELLLSYATRQEEEESEFYEDDFQQQSFGGFQGGMSDLPSKELVSIFVYQALLMVFDSPEEDEKEQQMVVMDLLRSNSLSLQRHLLRALSTQVRRDANGPLLLSITSAWRILFSDSFFFYGGQQQPFSYTAPLTRTDLLRAQANAGQHSHRSFSSLQSNRSMLLSQPLSRDTFMDFLFRSSAASTLIGSTSHKSLEASSERIEATVRYTAVSSTAEAEAIRDEVLGLLEFAAATGVASDIMEDIRALLIASLTASALPRLLQRLVESLHRVLSTVGEGAVEALRELHASAVLIAILEKQADSEGQGEEASIARGKAGGTGKGTSGQQQEEAAETEGREAEAKPGGQDVSGLSLANQAADNLSTFMAARMSLFRLVLEYLGSSPEVLADAAGSKETVESLTVLVKETQSRQFAIQAMGLLMQAPPLPGVSLVDVCRRCLMLLGQWRAKPTTASIHEIVEVLTRIRQVIDSQASLWQPICIQANAFHFALDLLKNDADHFDFDALCLEVLQLLTTMMSGSEETKIAMRREAGEGYPTLEAYLLMHFKGKTSWKLLQSTLDMAADGVFAFPHNASIQNADALVLFFHLLKKADEDDCLRGLQTLLQITQASLANRAKCIEAGLTGRLVRLLPTVKDAGKAELVVGVMQEVAGYSLSGKDLNAVLRLLRDTDEGKRPRHAKLLLQMLQMFPEREGPDIFFELSGRDSGLALKSSLKLASSGGYTFSCWLRIEDFPKTKASETPPQWGCCMAVASFMSDLGKGFSLFISRAKLILHVGGARDEICEAGHKMKVRQWYHLVLEHSASAFGGGVVKAYVDGQLVDTAKTGYPKFYDPLTKVSIAAKASLVVPPISGDDDEAPAVYPCPPFVGQISQTYLFAESVSQSQVAALFSLGPRFLLSSTENDLQGADDSLVDAIDGLQSKILLSFNAQASSGQTVFDLSPSVEKAEAPPHDANALLGTQLCRRQSLHEAITVIGGAPMLLPLATLLDQSNESGMVDYTVMTDVVRLIGTILVRSRSCQQDMAAKGGFGVLAFTMKRLSPLHLTMDLVHAIEALIQNLSRQRDDALIEELVKAGIKELLLDPKIWSLADVEVQCEVYKALLRLEKTAQAEKRSLPQVATFGDLIDLVTKFYSIPQKEEGGAAVDAAKRRGILKVRQAALGIAEQTLQPGVGFTQLDVVSLVALFEDNYLDATRSVKDASLVADVLGCVLSLLCTPLARSFNLQLQGMGDMGLLLSLLRREEEELRVLGVRIIGALMLERRGDLDDDDSDSDSGFDSDDSDSDAGDMVKSASSKPSGNEPQKQTQVTLVDAIFHGMAKNLASFSMSAMMEAALFDVLKGKKAEFKPIRNWADLRAIGASGIRSLAASAVKPKGLKALAEAVKRSSEGKFVFPQALEPILRQLLHCATPLRRKVLQNMAMMVDMHERNRELFLTVPNWQYLLFNLWTAVTASRPSLTSSSAATASTTAATDGSLLVEDDSASIEDVEVQERALARMFLALHSFAIFNTPSGHHQLLASVHALRLYHSDGKLPFLSIFRGLLADLLAVVTFRCPSAELLSAESLHLNMAMLMRIVEMVLLYDTKALFFVGSSSSSSGSHQATSGIDSNGDSHGEKHEQHDASDGTNTSHDGWGWIAEDSTEELALIGGSKRSEAAKWGMYRHLWTLLAIMNDKAEAVAAVTAGMFHPFLVRRYSFGSTASMSFDRGVVAEMLADVDGDLEDMFDEEEVAHRHDPFHEVSNRLVLRLMLLHAQQADEDSLHHSMDHFTVLLPVLLTDTSHWASSRVHLLLRALENLKLQVASGPDADISSRNLIIAQLAREVAASAGSLLVDGMDEQTAAERNERSKSNLPMLGDLVNDSLVADAVAEERKHNETLFSELMRGDADVAAELEERLTQLQELVAGIESSMVETVTHVHLVDLERRRESVKAHGLNQDQIVLHWNQMMRESIIGRGPWSSADSAAVFGNRWKLDRVEDPLRRRMRLRPNYRPLLNNKMAVMLKAAAPEDLFTKLEKKLRGHMKVVRDEEQWEEKEDDDEESPKMSGLERMEATLKAQNKNTEYSSGVFASTLMMTLQEAQEKKFRVPCILITEKRKIAGNVEIFNHELIFEGTFVMSHDQSGTESFDDDGLKRSMEEKKEEMKAKREEGKAGAKWRKSATKILMLKRFMPQLGEQKKISVRIEKDMDFNVDVKMIRRWSLKTVVEVFSRRYLLEASGCEVFFESPTPPSFFNFSSTKKAADFAKKLCDAVNSARKRERGREKLSVIDGKKARELAEKAKGLWKSRAISNFEYLMALNTLSGRSYNVVNQYPVFPWVISDYTSQHLDLSSPASYRDLSKPIGALDEKRLQIFEDRFSSFQDSDDDGDEIPRFLYGSHYSSAGIVLFFLIRMEPFATFNHMLQGGRFDHADRLFNSIPLSWNNCLHNTSDVKELIPEFFYSSEFLINSNGLDLGVRQDGERMGDVVLPPWAEGSAEKFIRMNREALEGDFVSANLHHWIDLIFGFKQTGPASVEAKNVFFYLTYEDRINVESLTDPVVKRAIEDQIANFGQTPRQLFNTPHSKRSPKLPLERSLSRHAPSYQLVAVTKQTAAAAAAAAATTGGAGGQRRESEVLFVGACKEGKVVSWSAGQTITVRPWTSPFSSQIFASDPIGEPTVTRRVRIPSAANALSSASFALLSRDGCLYFITAGHWDNSAKFISLKDGQIASSIRHHSDAVTCISASSDGSLVATGSKDTTIVIWPIIKHSRRKEILFPEKPLYSLSGHSDGVTAVAAVKELDIVVSASLDGTVAISSLASGRFIRQMEYPNKRPIQLMVVSKWGNIAVHSKADRMLHLCSLNGKWLAATLLDEEVSSLAMSTCGDFLVAARDTGAVAIHCAHTLELVHACEGTGSPLSSVFVTNDDCILAGTVDGDILTFASKSA